MGSCTIATIIQHLAPPGRHRAGVARGHLALAHLPRSRAASGWLWSPAIIEHGVAGDLTDLAAREPAPQLVDDAHVVALAGWPTV